MEKQKQEYSALLESGEREQYRTALNFQHSRRSFVGKQGYLGLVPQDAKEGDLVVVLFGAVQPFILRSEGDRYKQIGEAFVYGIMDGEFMKTKYIRNDFELV